MASIRLENLCKNFPDGSAAVKDVSIAVDDREFLVLVGPSGCGKSTTLRMIAGLESVSDGTIQIGDNVVNHVAPKDRDIAMVFQNYALYPHMTVYNNMSFGLRLRFGGGVFARVVRRLVQPDRAAKLESLRKGIDQQVRQTASRLGIEKLLDRKPYQLSGGERQRVALGRAIVRNPAAFLFDEPLSNLDAKLRGQMRIELKRLHQELGATMIYVTHDQVEAMTLGDRIAVMNDGEILQVGKPIAVYQQPANLFVARFIGSVPMNLVLGMVKNDNGEYRFESGQINFNVEFGNIPIGLAGKVAVGFRSESIEIVEDDHPDSHLFGKVIAIDRLGDTSHLHVVPEGRLQDTQVAGVKMSDSFVVKTASDTDFSMGESVKCRIKTEQVLWFDADNGQSLKKE